MKLPRIPKSTRRILGRIFRHAAKKDGYLTVKEWFKVESKKMLDSFKSS